MLSNDLTERQLHFLITLKAWMEKNKKPMPRTVMKNIIGVGVDNIAFALWFKGLVAVDKKGGRVYYRLKNKA